MFFQPDDEEELPKNKGTVLINERKMPFIENIDFYLW